MPQGALPPVEAMSFGAIALFVERAQACDDRFVLTDANVAAVIELCRSLDGMALAIELAAARAHLIGVERLAQSIDARLKLLTSSADRLAPERHQTLRAALEWSHDLLDERERIVFARMAVIAGSSSLQFIQSVIADADASSDLDEWSVLDSLGILVERSLVNVVQGDRSEPRYRLLESPRAFALERLAARGELDLLRERHANAMADMLSLANRELSSGRMGELRWEAALVPDLGNMRDALAWARLHDRHEILLTIVVVMGSMVTSVSTFERHSLGDLIPPLLADDSIPLQLRAHALLCLGRRSSASRLRTVADHLPGLIAAMRAHAADDDGRYLLYHLLLKWVLVVARLQLDVDADGALKEAGALHDPAWPAVRRWLLPEAESFHFAERDPKRALASLRRVADLCVEAGAGITGSLVSIADAELAAGEFNASIETGRKLVASLDGGRDEFYLAFGRMNLAAAHLALDQLDEARGYAVKGWPQSAVVDIEAPWSDHLSLLCALEGRPRSAARLCGFGDAAYERATCRREVNELAAFERATRQASERLGLAEFDRLRAEGREMAASRVAELAFGETDSAD
ncbi:hypothetical protein BH09PSE6_BH09PSE6_13680 [soil metagenome]